jgi:DNA-binding NarL/FixJ family response regulator
LRVGSIQNYSFAKCSTKAGTGRSTLKKVRVFARPVPHEKKQEVNESSMFVFCEKTTGVAQFRAQSFADSGSTLERIASLLAMQCLVRGQEPEDFAVLVPADRNLAGRLVSRAKDLLEVGREVSGPATLSPRQREILRSVICNRANKEIASKLNITVRTVKFHISSLLNKFGVENRTELARRAAGLLRPIPEDAPVVERTVGDLDRRGMGPLIVGHSNNKTSGARFSGRAQTA